jgi:nucleotide-binding universal stress UspA family protein
MRKTILVGLDGSPDGDAALEAAVLWARSHEAELVGMAVVDEPTIRRSEPTGIGGSSFKRERDEALLADARSQVRGLLDRFAQRCEAAGVSHREDEEVGLPSARLLSVAADVDWTVLGQQTHYHFVTQAAPCETLRAVLRSCPRPVAVVPPQGVHGSSVLVAYDASPPAVRALDAFRRSGLDEGRPVQVVSIAAEQETAARRAEEAARFLRFYGMQAEALPLAASADEAELILGQAARQDARLIVVGTFGRSRLSELFSRSTTAALLRQADRVLFCNH